MPAPVLGSVLEAVGNTPLLRLHIPGLPPGSELWGKCEWMNPGGSVKDRTALSLITEGERSGALVRGKTIIDSSSGNTAVGLALVGAAKGFQVELVMPANASPERRALCEAYGARIIPTDPLRGSDGAIERVREMVGLEPEKYFYADQYRNPANPLAHYRTTAPEIVGQTSGRLTHFVAGLGTTGTVVGTSRYLRAQAPWVKIVGVSPTESLHGLEGLKHMETSIVPEIYDLTSHDEVVRIETAEAYEACREILASDGIFVGHSAGAALAAARKVAREGSVIVALLPDGGERYLER